MKHYASNRCEPSIEALNFRGGGGGQGKCEWRSEVFVKIQKKNQNRCERRSKVFLFVFFFFFLGGGGLGRRGGGQFGGDRVDVNEELKFL